MLRGRLAGVCALADPAAAAYLHGYAALAGLLNLSLPLGVQAVIGFVDSMWGMLFGSAFLLVLAVGPLLVAGPLVGMLVGALEGAVVFGSVSALGAALASLGIPENSVLEYETEIKVGKYMLLAHGPPAEVARAQKILGLETAALVPARRHTRPSRRATQPWPLRTSPSSFRCLPARCARR